MPAIDNSAIDLDAIDRATLERDPFDYLVVPACIPTEPLTAINRDYPDISRPGNLNVEDTHYGPAFAAFLDELQSPELAARISAKFGVALDSDCTTITVRKFCEQSDGNIHTDHRSKVITVLFYFNQDWSRDEGRLRLLRGNKDIEDFVAEVPPIGGTLLAFRRTDHSWHGHKPFVGERRMLQLNYLQSGTFARLHQRVNRLGTRTMKKALRLFQPAG